MLLHIQHKLQIMQIMTRKKGYLNNRPHFRWVYRRDKPREMLGEHEKSL